MGVSTPSISVNTFRIEDRQKNKIERKTKQGREGGAGNEVKARLRFPVDVPKNGAAMNRGGAEARE